MSKEPIPGLSDQRYFYIALLSRRKKSLSLRWLWDALGKDAPLGSGRFPSTSGGGRYECKVITESRSFAGSPDAVTRLATPDGNGTCDYDLVAAMTEDIVMLGSGYRSLTRALFKRLVKQQHILEAGWFLRPKLDAIAEMFQNQTSDAAKKAARLDVALSATGLTAAYSPGKNLRGLRLGGSAVFSAGIIKLISQLMEASVDKGLADTESDAPAFGYKMIRVCATDRITGGSASLTMTPDGSFKFWLRKGGRNIPDVIASTSALASLRLFEERAEPPAWAEDEEL